MPHLVSGHMRFTEEDFLLSDYKEKAVFKAVAGAEKPVEVDFDFNSEKK